MEKKENLFFFSGFYLEKNSQMDSHLSSKFKAIGSN